MATFQCSSCGRTIQPAPTCPACGAEQGDWAAELLRIEKSIAEMKARDAAIASEQRQIAQKMQAALFQRDILAHANEERLKAATKTRRLRIPRRQPATKSAPAPGAPGVPRQDPPPAPRAPRQDPPPAPAPRGGTRPRVERPTGPVRRPDGPARPAPPDTDHRPAEASSRQVQNILLGLGALLLGVAAVVFALFAISSFDDLTRVGILALATGLMLAAAPAVARQGLTATAETIAAIGLLLLPLVGFAVWAMDTVWHGGVSGPVFAGATLLVSAALSAGYAGLTGLAAG
ncbi:MAG TPA: permease, partial [Micromonospora sp.]